MKKLTLIILSFSLLWINYSCNKRTDKDNIVRSKNYRDAIIESHKETSMYMFQNDVPGLNVAVYHENKLVWSDAIGYANKELKTFASTKTKFRIGGVSKLFTGAIVAKKIEEGILDLKTPIIEYYPELPEDKSQINLSHLLWHTSGIRPVGYKEEINKGYVTMRKGIGVFIEDSLMFKPGLFQNQTEFGYDLIGATLERKFDKHYNKILKSTLTDTLNLTSTVCDDPTWIIDNRSQCYDKNMVARAVRAVTQDNRHRAASVGLLSSALDIAKLCNEYLYPDYFKPKTIDLILTKGKLPNGMELVNGLGLIVTKDNRDRDIYLLAGTTKGGSASLLIYPEYKLVISMACNISQEGENLPIFKIASSFINQIDPAPEEETK